MVTFWIMSAGILTDEELLSAYRTGAEPEKSQAYATELFARYHSRVAAWCLRITGDRESAADLAQEVFIKAFRHLDSFEGNSKFSTWIYSIVRNHCFNHLRSMARRPEEAGEEVLGRLPSPEGEDVLARLVRQSSERRALEIVNAELDDTEKTVMVLHYAEEMTLDAVTRLLALENPSGAKAYIVSAKRKIQRALERSP